MDASPSLPLMQQLPLPRHGQSVRLQMGASELVLESVRGGHSLLWSDGRQARKYALGLTSDGVLSLQLRAPRLPLRVVVRDVVAVVPGGRIAGYLQLPLVPTLQWTVAGRESMSLVELTPADLQAEWDDSLGSSYRVAAALHVRFPMRSGEPKVVVPFRLRNASPVLLSPECLPLALTDRELRERRGSILVAPRRLHWDGAKFEETASQRLTAGSLR